ncbi:MAG: hypothetical protein WCD35_12805, partial [Mycobacteriales bacterium]
RLEEEPQYGLPYVRLPHRPLRDVLVIGAGSGNDVAIALAKGAQHVDAVEIDPRILQIGRELNPDHPYQDPRVTTHVTDGRAFLENTHRRYDLVLFALPDSLALVTGASAIRLESYLFTVQAVQAARAHVSEHGGFAMYNFYREQWLVQRLAGTVAAAFGHDPCIDETGRYDEQSVIAVARRPQDQVCDRRVTLAADRVTPAADDQPFLYFRGSSLPLRYVVTLALVLLASLVCVRAAGGPLRGLRGHLDLFCMGAAFLLLETRNIATFALLFGTTWVVNAIVFAGVLVAVLLAVETTRLGRTPPLPVVYAGIASTLGLAWAVPDSWLLGLPYAARLPVAVALAFAPVYLANIAFSKRFAQTADSTSAFAVNVLGAMVGGCLEYGALLTGYRALLVVIGALYLAAFSLAPKGLRWTAT